MTPKLDGPTCTESAPSENSESSDYPESNQEAASRAVRAVTLIEIRETLESAEALLLDPTPEHIDRAESLLAQAAHNLTNLDFEGSPELRKSDPPKADILALNKLLSRLLALLRGALRVQWHRMRRTGLYIETYNSTGKSKVCLHRKPRVDLEV